MKKFFSLLSLTCIMMLSACASNENIINDEDKTAEQLYTEGYNYLEKTSYQKRNKRRQE